MLFICRVTFTFFYCIIVCIVGSIYCLLISPRNPKHVVTFGRIFGRLAIIFGIKVETRKPEGSEKFGNAIYIANHQNNYDMITAVNIVQSPTITVGKKSIIWIPFFGQLYWLSGNILIDRNNNIKAGSVVKQIINCFKKLSASVWIFPEGTRSYGRGLLPFKIGAFYIAIMTGVPIIPICISNTCNKINLNRFNNGLVIVEMLPPIDVNKYSKNQVHKLANYCRELMINKIIELDKEVMERENNGNI